MHSDMGKTVRLTLSPSHPVKIAHDVPLSPEVPKLKVLIRLVDRPSAIRNLDSVLEVAVDVEQAPVGLPFVVRRVELVLPRLVKGGEPVVYVSIKKRAISLEAYQKNVVPLFNAPHVQPSMNVFKLSILATAPSVVPLQPYAGSVATPQSLPP